MSKQNSSVPATPKIGKWFRLRRMSTWRIWAPVLLLLAGLMWWSFAHVHRWLCVTDRLDHPRYVVVEGWVPDHVLLEARREFEDTGAKLLFTTGGPLERGGFLSDYHDYATLAANTLAKTGLAPQSISPVPADASLRDRTAAAATKLRETLAVMNVPQQDRQLQLVTLGAHSRRSRLIYQRMLGSDWQVGVIAVPDSSYDEQNWWRHSAGAKRVVDELVALTIAKFGGD